jgi:beta-glucosidase
MKFTGTLTPPVTGSYEFESVGTGGWSLSIDGREVLSTGSGELERQTASVPLVAGRSYQVEFDYVNGATGRAELGPHIKLGWKTPAGVVAPQATAAAKAAKKADVAVVFVRDYGTEGGDRPSMRLPLGQEELIKAVAKANKNTIVVMTTAGPTITSTWDRNVAGVIDAFYGGQNQGAAIARILYGDVNPSGKLPVTIPTSDTATPLTTQAQFPGIGLDTFYDEGVFVGYRGYDQDRIVPDHEFGFGLSYTTFKVDNLSTRVTGGSEVEATVTVKNTGKVAGSEVVQAYLGKLPTQVVDTPPKQLAGWAKVSLDPGQSKRVTIALDQRMLSYWDSYSNEWITPKGDVSCTSGRPPARCRCLRVCRSRQRTRRTTRECSTARPTAS